MNSLLSRRELIRRGLRYGGLGAIGGVAALLASRSRDCATSGPCGGCPLFKDCALPKAESAKQAPAEPEYPSRDG